jgi:hypothetical protein
VSREIGGRGKFKTRSQDKGHAHELASFINCISNGGTWPISFEELVEVSKVTIDMADQVRVQLAQQE